MNGPLILLFFLCVAWSFLMSGMEAGVFALSRLRIRQLMRQGDRRATALYDYLDNPEDFLWTILVGNTLANFAVVSMGVMWLFHGLWPYPWWLFGALVAGILAFYAVCELLPKTLFRLHPNRLCLALALPFRFVHLALKPVVGPMALLSRLLVRWTGGRPFTGHLFGNRDELRIVMQESAQGLTGEERRMINRVLDLQNLSVRSITTPFSQTVSVTTQTPTDEVLRLARERGFSRLPVWNEMGGRRRIVGLVNVRTLLYEENPDPKKTVGDFLRPALYLDDGMRLELALKQLQRTGQRLAVVVTRDQQELGLVSLQDILKVIFGEVRL
jgi:CBS domain containing-hemolysin-like protein